MALMKEAVNHRKMKERNQLTILRAIHLHEPVSRMKIKTATDLSWGTTTTVIKDLLDRRIISELRTRDTTRGRKPVELGMNAKRNMVAGLQLGCGFAASVLLDVRGELVHSVEIPVPISESKENLLDALFTVFQRLTKEARVARTRIAGIGFASPGAVDFASGTCRYAPHHPHWREVPIRQLFLQHYRGPFFLSHDNDCQALGEKWFGHGRGLKNFVSISLDIGISAGIIADGKVYRGFNDTSGEFGHICIDPNGPECVCTRHGCLEVYASTLALERRMKEAIKIDQGGDLARLARQRRGGSTMSVLAGAADNGNPDARRIFAEMGRSLGMGLSTLINILNPETVIVGGVLAEHHRHFLPVTQQVINEFAWRFSRKEIMLSSLHNAIALGAGALVLEEIYGSGLLLKAKAATR